MFLVSRRIGWAQQPQGVSNVALPLGLVHIASYLPNGYSDVSGREMTRGSAAAFAVTGAGRALKQTAVNTSIYRPIVGLPTGQDKYLAVWAGVVVGGPTSTTPKLLGISTTATSQSVDFLGIERGSTSADHLQVTSKSNTGAVNREFNVGLTSLYGKQITLVGVYSAVDDVARLHVYAGGVVTTYSSAVSSAAAPAVLGTERFVVGVDIVENPTRSANVNCNLASIFAGTCSLAYELVVAKNPWQIFAPRETRIFVPLGAGGGAVNLIVADAAHGHTADSPAFSMDTYLAVAESLHGHAAANLTLSTTGAANLVVQDAAHAHIADSISLTTNWLLSIADALHSHVADNLSLDTSNATFLTVQDSSHSHSADSLGFSLDTWLAIVDAAHAHAADAPTLSASVALLIAEALHAHYADVAVLSLPGETTLTPEDITAIAAAVLAALNATTIPVDVQKMNSAPLIGTGTLGDDWRGVGVPPQ